MKRLLFIGNSHLAAVKAAWQATPQHHQAEFFGTPQRAWLRMTHLPGNAFGLSNDTDAGFARQRKITEQANGKAAVSLADRDVIILIGALSATDPVAPVLATCDIPTLRETAVPTLLSPQLFTAICTTLAQGSAPQPGWHHTLTQASCCCPARPPAKPALAAPTPPFSLGTACPPILMVRWPGSPPMTPPLARCCTLWASPTCPKPRKPAPTRA